MGMGRESVFGWRDTGVSDRFYPRGVILVDARKLKIELRRLDGLKDDLDRISFELRDNIKQIEKAIL